jgi:hypothetical protein
VYPNPVLWRLVKWLAAMLVEVARQFPDSLPRPPFV